MSDELIGFFVMDRISNLPDEIICHIGSFLSAKEAAFAMVLSRRWRNLFTIVPNLHFDSLVTKVGSFTEFADRVFALPVTSRVRKFSLKWRSVDSNQYDHINRCLCHVLKRGVLDLELRINGTEGYTLPFEVFISETVDKLTLGFGFVIDFLPADAFLPALKTLCLDSIRLHEFGRCCTFNTILSVSPKLEELVIDGVEFERWKWSFTVSSPTLRRLTMRRRNWDGYSDLFDTRGLSYEFDSLIVDTPALTYLEYDDYVPKEYPFVNLSSLVEAKVDLRADCVEGWEEEHADNFNPMNLINGLKNVEILGLNVETMLMIGIFREAIPMFKNLLHIFVDLSNFCWDPLEIMVNKSPNLKTLTIEDLLHYDYHKKESPFVCECVSEYSFLLSCPLEVLKIMKYDGSIGELEQMKHLLEKLACLELVEVKVRAHVKGEEKVRVLTDLLMLPRASTNCKIQVKFS